MEQLERKIELVFWPTRFCLSGNLGMQHFSKTQEKSKSSPQAQTLNLLYTCVSQHDNKNLEIITDFILKPLILKQRIKY